MKIIELNPNYVKSYGNIAGCYRDLGDDEKAKEWIKKGYEVVKKKEEL